MAESKIEWTNYTWNPITGCKNGCSYCYARKMAENPFYAKSFPYKFEPHFYPARVMELAKIPEGSKVFVCSMAELFADGQEQWTDWVINRIKEFKGLTFQVLTKQPQNLIKYSPFPKNCWVGVSATNNFTYLGDLKNVKAKVKFISFEPLLSWDMGLIHQRETFHEILNKLGITWVIIGQQTPQNKKTMPKVEWIKDIVTACDKAEIPVFLKNNLKQSLPFDVAFREKDKDGISMSFLRQEMPKVK